MVAGGIDDLRIWSVARTQDQIRQTMFARYSSSLSPASFPSLEAWYTFEGNAKDSWHTHHGTIVGNGFGFDYGAAFPNQYLKLQGFPQHGYVEVPADLCSGCLPSRTPRFYVPNVADCSTSATTGKFARPNSG